MLRRAANTRGSVEARRLAASATRSGLWRRSQRPWSRGASMDIRVRESGRCAPTFGPEGRIAREKPGRGCKKSLLIYERGDLWVSQPCLSVREPCGLFTFKIIAVWTACSGCRATLVTNRPPAGACSRLKPWNRPVPWANGPDPSHTCAHRFSCDSTSAFLCSPLAVSQVRSEAC